MIIYFECVSRLFLYSVNNSWNLHIYTIPEKKESGHCKDCKKTKDKEWRDKNKEHKRKKDKAYYEENKEVILDQCREKYRSNRIQILSNLKEKA